MILNTDHALPSTQESFFEHIHDIEIENILSLLFKSWWSKDTKDPLTLYPKRQARAFCVRHQGTKAVELVPHRRTYQPIIALEKLPARYSGRLSRRPQTIAFFFRTSPLSLLFSLPSHHNFPFHQSRANVVLVATWLPTRRQNKRHSCFPAINEIIILSFLCRAS